jgi:hypothetical protein
MMRLASLPAISALLLASSPAGATTDCIRDESAAYTAARIYAASQFCASMNPAKGEDARHLAVLFGAARASEAAKPTCSGTFAEQAEHQAEQVAALGKIDQQALCLEVTEMLKDRRRLKAQLIKLKVMKPVVE